MAKNIIAKRAVYAIQSTDGRAYVGGSNRLKARWKEHRTDLRNGRHHSILLQEAWDVLSESDFTFIVLEVIPLEDDLIAAEQRYMDGFRLRGMLLNASPTAGLATGSRRSVEVRAQMSARLIGRKVSEVTRAKMSASKIGKKHTPESRANMGISKIGLLAGEKHPLAKVTEQDVVAIRQLVSDGEPRRIIAARFGTSGGTVYAIATKRRWAHITG